MAKLKPSSEFQKVSKKSKAGKLNRSTNSDAIGSKNDCTVPETNGSIKTTLKKKKLKIHNEKDVDEYNNAKEIINENASSDDNTSSIPMNVGWADVMQKILRTKKPKKKKSIVLSKAKKLQDVKLNVEEDNSLEVDGTKTESIEETSKNIGSIDESQEHVQSVKKDASLGIRVKPSFANRERERMLQKIATKGVVQLFNAVKEQQTEISNKLSEAGPLERKREKVLKDIDKNTFLDVLMGGARSVPVVEPHEPNAEQDDEKEDKIWSVLRDDFVMGAKLRDWDKKSDSENENSSAPEDMDSDE